MGSLIAVIDDDADFLDLLGELLRDEGFRTLSRATRAGAQMILRAARPDLVILDLWLERPGDGWEVLRELRGDPQTAVRPVLVCSASPALARDLALPTHWMLRALVPKPFALDDFVAHIHGCLGQAMRTGGCLPSGVERR